MGALLRLPSWEAVLEIGFSQANKTLAVPVAEQKMFLLHFALAYFALLTKYLKPAQPQQQQQQEEQQQQQQQQEEELQPSQNKYQAAAESGKRARYNSRRSIALAHSCRLHSPSFSLSLPLPLLGSHTRTQCRAHQSVFTSGPLRSTDFAKAKGYLASSPAARLSPTPTPTHTPHPPPTRLLATGSATKGVVLETFLPASQVAAQVIVVPQEHKKKEKKEENPPRNRQKPTEKKLKRKLRVKK